MAASEEAKALREEFERTNEALRDITANLNLAAQNTEGFDEAAKKVVKTYSNDLTKATDQIVKSNQRQLYLQEEITKGGKRGAAAQKEYAKEQEKADRARKIATESINTLRSKGIEISAEDAFKVF
jgi:molecular chaperone GrpE (heat shock protein)